MSPEVFPGHRNVIQGEHHDIGVMLVREVLDNGERGHMEMPRGNRACYKRSYGMPMTCPVRFTSRRSGLLSRYLGNKEMALGSW